MTRQLTIIISLAISNILVFGRQLKPIDGACLLIEFKKTANGPHLPGIYAWNLKENSCFRIASYGTAPSWSRDHKYFVYRQRWNTIVYNVETGKTRIIDQNGGFVKRVSPVLGMGYVIPPMSWTPSGREILAYDATKYPGDASLLLYPKTIPTSDEIDSDLYRQHLSSYVLNSLPLRRLMVTHRIPATYSSLDAVSVGRISFGAKDSQFAAEVIFRNSIVTCEHNIYVQRDKTSQGKVFRPIRTADVKMYLNPLLTRTGDKLAFDVVFADGSRRSFVYNFLREQILHWPKKIEEDIRTVPTESAICWSPNGQQLYGIAGDAEYVFNVKPEEISVCKFLCGGISTVQACWSPSGRYLAVVRYDDKIWRSFMYSMGIVAVNELDCKKRRINHPYHPVRFKDLSPVQISW